MQSNVFVNLLFLKLCPSEVGLNISVNVNLLFLYRSTFPFLYAPGLSLSFPCSVSVSLSLSPAFLKTLTTGIKSHISYLGEIPS